MLDWREIDTVLLDMDGTLLDLNFDNHFWQEFVPLRYAELHGLTLEAAKVALAPRFKAMEGKLEWYCLDYWSEELNLNIAGLKQELAGLIAVHPHVVEFLEAARGRGVYLLLVTNAHRDSLSLKMEKTCLHRFFDRIVSSHDVGLAKEQCGFWRRLQDQHVFEKQRTLLVDDSLAVLRSAAAFGIAHLVSISKPDSRRPIREITEFPAVEDFRALMPGLL
ncbi:GMP/IMP nucleotidase [Methylomonas sp. MED-D]|uniref:GMP/IMP nucleotidase n=1 Tax=unclassified Methylomonas TaxID=2608980 RepID=UPI00247939C3|nr:MULTISPECIES: GMP/IMP nucleotidase [unclassified Methylomonas]MDT4330651.1 GMP/IMP nucleotidase [Methylomonas sp. MV1]WGS86220.1 GMP/IMP nucleotidase [Methylomonas sp. UP202]